MKVLLTRPKIQSAAMEKELIALGVETVVEPLLEVRPLVWDMGALNVADAIIVTSANAVPSLPREWSRDFSIFAVGPDTAEALNEAGFADVRPARGTADDLLRLIRAQWKPRDGALLYLSGRDVSQDLAAQLRRQGYEATRVPVYAAEPVASLSPATTSMFRRGELSGVILMSVRTAQTFRSLVAANQLEAACRDMTVFCLSSKIADALGPLQGAAVAIASTPTRAGMLHAIKSAQASLAE